MYLLFLCGGGSSKLTMNNMRVLSRSTLHLRMTMCTRWRSARSPIPHLLSIYRDLRTAKLPYRGGRGVRCARRVKCGWCLRRRGCQKKEKRGRIFIFVFIYSMRFCACCASNESAKKRTLASSLVCWLCASEESTVFLIVYAARELLLTTYQSYYQLPKCKRLLTVNSVTTLSTLYILCARLVLWIPLCVVARVAHMGMGPYPHGCRLSKIPFVICDACVMCAAPCCYD